VAEQITLKAGASFNLALAFNSDAGVAIDMTPFTVAAQVRDAEGVLVTDLPITLQPTLGTGSISVLDTSGWPLGMLRCDVRVSSSTEVLISQTFSILVLRAVTQ
jgi:hypothetical protein